MPTVTQMRSPEFLLSWSSAWVEVAGAGTEDATGTGGIKDDGRGGGSAAAGDGKYAGGGTPGTEDGRDIAFFNRRDVPVCEEGE